MTKKEFKAISEKLRDSKVHLCVAELSEGSVPVGAHGKINEVVALATYALIAAIRQSREPFRTYLRTKAATDILNSMVDDTSVFNGGRAKRNSASAAATDKRRKGNHITASIS